MVRHQILTTIDLSQYVLQFQKSLSMLYFISFLITCLTMFCHEEFGFRTGHSTEPASLQLTDYLIKRMDQGGTPLNIYIDQSKAFDTLDHSILLYKLSYYGITGCENKLFVSYLSNRYQ